MSINFRKSTTTTTPHLMDRGWLIEPVSFNTDTGSIQGRKYVNAFFNKDVIYNIENTKLIDRLNYNTFNFKSTINQITVPSVLVQMTPETQETLKQECQQYINQWVNFAGNNIVIGHEKLSDNTSLLTLPKDTIKNPYKNILNINIKTNNELSWLDYQGESCCELASNNLHFNLLNNDISDFYALDANIQYATQLPYIEKIFWTLKLIPSNKYITIENTQITDQIDNKNDFEKACSLQATITKSEPFIQTDHDHQFSVYIDSFSNSGCFSGLTKNTKYQVYPGQQILYKADSFVWNGPGVIKSLETLPTRNNQEAIRLKFELDNLKYMTINQVSPGCVVKILKDGSTIKTLRSDTHNNYKMAIFTTSKYTVQVAREAGWDWVNPREVWVFATSSTQTIDKKEWDVPQVISFEWDQINDFAVTLGDNLAYKTEPITYTTKLSPHIKSINIPCKSYANKDGFDVGLYSNASVTNIKITPEIPLQAYASDVFTKVGLAWESNKGIIKGHQVILADVEPGFLAYADNDLSGKLKPQDIISFNEIAGEIVSLHYKAGFGLTPLKIKLNSSVYNNTNISDNYIILSDTTTIDSWQNNIHIYEDDKISFEIDTDEAYEVKKQSDQIFINNTLFSQSDIYQIPYTSTVRIESRAERLTKTQLNLPNGFSNGIDKITLQMTYSGRYSTLPNTTSYTTSVNSISQIDNLFIYEGDQIDITVSQRPGYKVSCSLEYGDGTTVQSTVDDRYYIHVSCNCQSNQSLICNSTVPNTMTVNFISVDNSSLQWTANITTPYCGSGNSPKYHYKHGDNTTSFTFYEGESYNIWSNIEGTKTYRRSRISNSSTGNFTSADYYGSTSGTIYYKQGQLRKDFPTKILRVTYLDFRVTGGWNNPNSFNTNAIDIIDGVQECAYIIDNSKVEATCWVKNSLTAVFESQMTHKTTGYIWVDFSGTHTGDIHNKYNSIVFEIEITTSGINGYNFHIWYRGNSSWVSDLDKRRGFVDLYGYKV